MVLRRVKLGVLGNGEVGLGISRERWGVRGEKKADGCSLTVKKQVLFLEQKRGGK